MVNMDKQKAVELLGQEWDIENGFLGKIRYREFDPEGLDRLLNLLEIVQNDDEELDEELIDRTLVSIIWFIPLFLEWQKQSFIAAGKDIAPLQSAINRIMPIMYNILGLP